MTVAKTKSAININMRRFSKIMVGRFIGYLDRADSDGNNDTSILFIVALFPEIHLFEGQKCKMY